MNDFSPQTREQVKRYHAQLGDIATQTTYRGFEFDKDDWKRITLNAYKYEMRDDPEHKAHWRHAGEFKVVPALNNPGLVILGEQSRRLTKFLASGYITWLLAFGNEQGVNWTDPYWLQVMKEAA